MEQTLSIIKPNAVKKNVIGAIIDRFERSGLIVKQMQMKHLTEQEAEGFYQEHSQRPFYSDLVAFMTSGPVVLIVLEGDNAIAKNREIMGDTNPAKAAKGTLRADFADSIEANAVHGSDSLASSQREIAFFFGS